MRILVANKFWYRRGGLERVLFDEVAWLEGAGHEVAHFSTRHPLNEPSPWSEYFAPYLELGSNRELASREKALAVVRLFHNGEATRRFARLIDEFRPDVVHVHGIHRQLSPGILRVARAKNVPVVQTLHDYQLLCPQDLLVRAGAVVCRPRLCGSVNVFPCVTHRCVQGSCAVSCLSALELLWRRWVLRYGRLVDCFIAPSEFLADMVRVSGLPHAPVEIVRNAVETRAAPGGTRSGFHATSEGDEAQASPADIEPGFFLYAGRVAAEKGAATIVRAAESAGIGLVVAGEGPLRASLAAGRPGGVEFVGCVDSARVSELLRAAVGAVVPSEWFENASMSVLEAMAAGKPVVASRIGGIPEQVRDGEEGLLVAPGDVDGFAEALRRLAADRELAQRLGEAARARAREVFSPEKHLETLERVYAEVGAPVLARARK